MVWVKSEYAGELAVVSAWLSALLPWYVSVTPSHSQFPGTVAFLRFPWAQIRYIFDFSPADAVTFSWPRAARGLVDRGSTDYVQSVHVAYDLWILAALVVAVAVSLSVAMYVDLERVEELVPIHPVRLMGGLLGVAGVLLTISTALFVLRSPFGEYPIPVGLVILLVLAGVLLRVDLLEVDASDGDEAEDSAAS